MGFHIFEKTYFCPIFTEKSLIQQCERSELRLHFKRTKVPKLETYSQTVLPDMSILIGQKLVENAKNGKIQSETFLTIFTQSG